MARGHRRPGKIWKLHPAKRRNPKNYTCPSGLRHVGGRPAEPWLLAELILTGLDAAIAVSHEIWMRAQVNYALRYVTWMQEEAPWCLIELLVVMELAKGGARSKGRSFYVGLMEGHRAGWTFATLIPIAVMYALPSAAAEVTMESNLEGMDGAGRSFRVDFVDRDP